MESRARSIAKTFTWRAVATVVTMCIAWKFTGDVSDSLGIGACDTAIKLFVYYGHERVWDRVGIGRPKPPEYTI